MTFIEVAGAKVDTRHYIGGARVASAETFTNTSPVDGSFLGEIARGGQAEIDLAVAAANKAFKGWAALGPVGRGELLMKLAELVEENIETLAQLETMDNGSLLRSHRRGVMPRVAMNIRFFADWAINHLGHEKFETRGHTNNISWDPSGVCALITPWNAPLMLATWKIGPALAAGDTVVLKPAEWTPLSASFFADLTKRAGIPDGVFNVVQGYGREAGAALVAHTDIARISFTGSVPTAKVIAKAAADNLTPLSFELGGKSPNLILDDLDEAGFAKAVGAGVGKCFANSGQTCSALTRMLVPRNRLAAAEQIAAAAAAKFTTGDPFDAASRLGPLVSAVQRDRVRGFIQTGIDEGATLVMGGAAVPEGLDIGFYVQPTIFSGVTREMTIFTEEIFGPVLSIIAYDSEEEAIEIANDTVYGLAAGVWGNDVEHAKKVARRLQAGQVEVNGGSFNIAAPFGGYKQSGLGREGGTFGLEEFCEVKAMQL